MPGISNIHSDALDRSESAGAAAIVLNAKFDTYPMRKTIPAQENAGLVADDFFERLH
ncbi:MAG: hypothetical protein U9N48_01800 [Euryarchaeota archaeon]|nr:hypothetical protein [Euryarchaeota archaeon]